MNYTIVLIVAVGSYFLFGSEGYATKILNGWLPWPNVDEMAPKTAE